MSMIVGRSGSAKCRHQVRGIDRLTHDSTSMPPEPTVWEWAARRAAPGFRAIAASRGNRKLVELEQSTSADTLIVRDVVDHRCNLVFIHSECDFITLGGFVSA